VVIAKYNPVSEVSDLLLPVLMFYLLCMIVLCMCCLNGVIKKEYYVRCVYASCFSDIVDCNRVYVAVSASVSSPLTPVHYNGQPVECSWTIDGGTSSQGLGVKVA